MSMRKKQREKEVPDYEDDISAREKTSFQSTWLSGKNEHSGRKKSIIREKGKRKKSFVSVSLPGIIAGGFLYLLFAS